MRALSYFFDEAVASLRRGYRTGAIATGTIAAALFVLGAFLVLTTNTERLFARWQEAAEFSVYLRDDATPPQRSAVEASLRASSLVRAVEGVSKEEAMRRFRRNFTELAAAVQDLPENPLPASFEVRLRPGVNPADVELLAEQTGDLGGVGDVRYDRRWIQRLMTAASAVRASGLALATVLIFVAALTVASVVRLALIARQDEIHIMQLVGAPLAYIRGPFVVEGFIEGGVGAVVAILVLWATFALVRSRQAAMIATAMDPSTVVFLSWPMCVALLAGGMAVGCIGGLIAAFGAREVAE